MWPSPAGQAPGEAWSGCHGNGGKASLCEQEDDGAGAETRCFFHLISLEKFYFKLWGEMCNILKNFTHLLTRMIFF